MSAAVAIDYKVVYGFATSLLSARYDNPQPTPEFHLELWRLCCLQDKFVAIAAPRGHAKSTAVTHDYVLAKALFGEKSNIMILSDTQDQANQFLHDIKVELTENQELIEMFKVDVNFVKDKESQIIVRFGDSGKLFRIFTKGAGQSLRGSKWRGKRPDLIVGDDMENDELVMNKERRDKLKKWLLAALVPMLSDSGQIRIVGTILHSDSLLQSLLDSAYWTSAVFEAHNDDFSVILWPDKFPEETLRELQAHFEEEGELELYNQEYRNIPVSDDTAIFRKGDFLDIEDFGAFGEVYIGVDLAISKKQKADYSVFSAMKMTSRALQLIDVRKDRLDSLQIVNEFFSLYTRFRDPVFIVEEENISRAIGPFLRQEMIRRGKFLTIVTMRPSDDIMLRCRSIAARHRAGGIEYDKGAEWYNSVFTELTRFPRAKNDDVVSSISLVGMYLDKMADIDEDEVADDFDPHEEDYDEYDDYDSAYNGGRCRTTGY